MGRDSHFNVNDKIIIHQVHKFFKENRAALTIPRLKSSKNATGASAGAQSGNMDSRALTALATGVGEATVARVVLEAARTRGTFHDKSHIADNRGRTGLIADDDMLAGLIREEVMLRLYRGERPTVANILAWLRDRYNFAIVQRTLYSYMQNWGFCTTRAESATTLQEKYSVKGERAAYLRFRASGHDPSTIGMPQQGGADVFLFETRYPITGDAPVEEDRKCQTYINILGAFLVEPPGTQADGTKEKHARVSWVQSSLKVWCSENTSRKRSTKSPPRPAANVPLSAYTGGSVHIRSTKFLKWYRAVCSTVQKKQFPKPPHLVMPPSMAKHLEESALKRPAATKSAEEIIAWLNDNGFVNPSLQAAVESGTGIPPTRDELLADVFDKNRVNTVALAIARGYGLEAAVQPKLHPELDIGRHFLARARCITWHHAIPLATGLTATVKEATVRVLESTHLRTENVYTEAHERVREIENLYLNVANQVTKADGTMITALNADPGEIAAAAASDLLVELDDDPVDEDDAQRVKRRRT